MFDNLVIAEWDNISCRCYRYNKDYPPIPYRIFYSQRNCYVSDGYWEWNQSVIELGNVFVEGWIAYLVPIRKICLINLFLNRGQTSVVDPGFPRVDTNLRERCANLLFSVMLFSVPTDLDYFYYSRNIQKLKFLIYDLIFKPIICTWNETLIIRITMIHDITETKRVPMND